MYNANEPNETELPSSASLLKSTLIAFVVAAIILVTIVLPAEYAIDPTGIGSALGLTRMGEIKSQLAEEAEADAGSEINVGSVGQRVPAPPAGPPTDATPAGTAQADPAPAGEENGWRDTTEITIAPEEAIELKLVMAKGEKAAYEWDAGRGSLNFNEHGDGNGQSIEYGKGRATPSRQGELIAAFDGYHGWFWRNRSEVPVSLTLRTRGSYSEIKRTR